jgi:bifunctional aspartokinase / homoserine dehydrogenase 1
MQVLKFGGSSVANEINIKLVAGIIEKATLSGKTIIVVSAIGGITDLLLKTGELAASNQLEYKQSFQLVKEKHIQIAEKLLSAQDRHLLHRTILSYCHELEEIYNGIYLLKEFSDRTKDRVASYGEILSSQILSFYLATADIKNEWVDSRDLITTNDLYTKAVVNFEASDTSILQFFGNARSELFILPGFIARSHSGETTTLGRGGSDYSAAILGAALNADLVEIWTDVSGMMTADPRLVPNAKTIETISFQEAMELSHFGAKVLYPPTIQPLMKKNISVWIRNTFSPVEKGTLIKSVLQGDNSIIRGISSINKIALISLEGSGMVGIPGISRRLFQALASRSINVILITQASSEHTICAGIEEDLADLAKSVVDNEFRNEIREGIINPLDTEKGLVIVALVGDNMKNHQGISGKLFSALGRNGVNIRAIAQGSSERNISTVISARDVKKAINVLHEEFFETSYKQVNLYIVGVGNVGSRLLEQINKQQEFLRQQMHLQVRVIGIAGRRKMHLNEKGIDLCNWKDALADGQEMERCEFIQHMLKFNLRNSVFVDVTAHPEIADLYASLLKKSISVVACNKIACSSSFEVYRQLKDLAREFNARFLFETNVGAGLPVISTLNDLLSSGDQVFRIEGVLSGTLNFVFNHYNGEASFASVVKRAQDEGYTEPDPRLDLSGTDVMRKILILVRETGLPLDMEQIENFPFLPESCMKGSVDDFYQEMEKHESHFRSLYSEAKKQGKILKYVAGFQDGLAKVGLEMIDPGHDFFHLYGKDNVVRFFTSRYKEQPLVVKGAGAGAEVTASGVFADIIKTASQ